jgi:hypothetical protein
LSRTPGGRRDRGGTLRNPHWTATGSLSDNKLI